MPRPIINGTTQPIRTMLSQSYDPQRGTVTSHEYESAGDGLGGIANECLIKGIPFKHTSNGRRSKLSFDVSDSIESDTWQLLCNENSKSIMEHPRVLALNQEDKDNPNSVKAVEAQVELHHKHEALKVPTPTGDALRLYNMLIRYVSSYQVGGYVLKHTTNVAADYAENQADLNVEKIYSTTALIAEITDGALWEKTCPDRLVYKIQHIQKQIASSEDVLWGWRKLPSQETTSASNRIDISTEYWLAAWTRLVYRGVFLDSASEFGDGITLEEE